VDESDDKSDGNEILGKGGVSLGTKASDNSIDRMESELNLGANEGPCLSSTTEVKSEGASYIIKTNTKNENNKRERDEHSREVKLTPKVTKLDKTALLSNIEISSGDNAWSSSNDCTDSKFGENLDKELISSIVEHISLSRLANSTLDSTDLDTDQDIQENLRSLSPVDEEKFDDDDDGFSIKTGRKNKNSTGAKGNFNKFISPDETVSKKIASRGLSFESDGSERPFGSRTVMNSVAEQTVKFSNHVFIKGTTTNIVEKSSVKLMKAFLEVDRSIKPEQVKKTKDCLKILCDHDEQKQKFLAMSVLLGENVSTSEHFLLRKNSTDHEDEYSKVIIFGVPIDITDPEIMECTEAVSVKRLIKKDQMTNRREFTETVILGFESEAPKYVYIGFTKFKTKQHIPIPRRCWNCQMFMHAKHACHRKAVCPNCAQNHEYADCPLVTLKEREGNQSELLRASMKCINCKGNHSAAFKGCPVYKKYKQVVEIQTVEKISYAEAFSRYNYINRENNAKEASKSTTTDVNEIATIENINLKIYPATSSPPDIQPTSISNPEITKTVHSFPDVGAIQLRNTYSMEQEVSDQGHVYSQKTNFPSRSGFNSEFPRLPYRITNHPGQSVASNPDIQSSNIIINQVINFLLNLLNNLFPNNVLVDKLNSFASGLNTVDDLSSDCPNLHL